MNDFDLIYLKNEDKYILDVETIYMFNTKDDEKEYMESILDLFTKWMIKNGYDIFNEISLFEMFTQGLNINSQFDSIEQAYAVFKALVKGYCNQ